MELFVLLKYITIRLLIRCHWAALHIFCNPLPAKLLLHTSPLYYLQYIFGHFFLLIVFCLLTNDFIMYQSIQRLLLKKNTEGDLDCEEDTRQLTILQLQSYARDAVEELDMIKEVT